MNKLFCIFICFLIGILIYNLIKSNVIEGQVYDSDQCADSDGTCHQVCATSDPPRCGLGSDTSVPDCVAACEQARGSGSSGGGAPSGDGEVVGVYDSDQCADSDGTCHQVCATSDPPRCGLGSDTSIKECKAACNQARNPGSSGDGDTDGGGEVVSGYDSDCQYPASLGWTPEALSFCTTNCTNHNNCGMSTMLDCRVTCMNGDTDGDGDDGDDATVHLSDEDKLFATRLADFDLTSSQLWGTSELGGTAPGTHPESKWGTCDEWQTNNPVIYTKNRFNYRTGEKQESSIGRFITAQTTGMPAIWDKNRYGDSVDSAHNICLDTGRAWYNDEKKLQWCPDAEIHQGDNIVDVFNTCCVSSPLPDTCTHATEPVSETVACPPGKYKKDGTCTTFTSNTCNENQEYIDGTPTSDSKCVNISTDCRQWVHNLSRDNYDDDMKKWLQKRILPPGTPDTIPVEDLDCPGHTDTVDLALDAPTTNYGVKEFERCCSPEPSNPPYEVPDGNTITTATVNTLCNDVNWLPRGQSRSDQGAQTLINNCNGNYWSDWTCSHLTGIRGKTSSPICSDEGECSQHPNTLADTMPIVCGKPDGFYGPKEEEAWTRAGGLPQTILLDPSKAKDVDVVRQQCCMDKEGYLAAQPCLTDLSKTLRDAQTISDKGRCDAGDFYDVKVWNSPTNDISCTEWNNQLKIYNDTYKDTYQNSPTNPHNAYGFCEPIEGESIGFDPKNDQGPGGKSVVDLLDTCCNSCENVDCNPYDDTLENVDIEAWAKGYTQNQDHANQIVVHAGVRNAIGYHHYPNKLKFGKTSEQCCILNRTCGYTDTNTGLWAQDFQLHEVGANEDRVCAEVTPCGINKYMSNPPTSISNTMCADCEAGTYNHASNWKNHCKTCESGKYRTEIMQGCEDMSICGLNKKIATPGTPSTDNSCRDCLLGHVSTDDDDTECHACEAGTYRDGERYRPTLDNPANLEDNPAADRCAECRDNMWSEAGWEKCRVHTHLNEDACKETLGWLFSPTTSFTAGTKIKDSQCIENPNADADCTHDSKEWCTNTCATTPMCPQLIYDTVSDTERSPRNTKGNGSPCTVYECIPGDGDGYGGGIRNHQAMTGTNKCVHNITGTCSGGNKEFIEAMGGVFAVPILGPEAAAAAVAGVEVACSANKLGNWGTNGAPNQAACEGYGVNVPGAGTFALCNWEETNPFKKPDYSICDTNLGKTTTTTTGTTATSTTTEATGTCMRHGGYVDSVCAAIPDEHICNAADATPGQEMNFSATGMASTTETTRKCQWITR